MSKPVIFTISAAWDDEASVWSGHCDDIPAAADAPTLDELLSKISAMALDLHSVRGNGPKGTGRGSSSRDASQESEIRGLDALQVGSSVPPRAHALCRTAWPKLAALAIALGLWQLVAISGWKESYVLPGPVAVLVELGHQLVVQDFWKAVGITMARGVLGFAIAAALGLTGSIKYAQFAGILPAALGAAVVAAWIQPQLIAAGDFLTAQPPASPGTNAP